MSLRNMVSEAFDNEIKRLYATRQPVKEFLLNHERKNLCIENLCKEIRVAEMSHAVNIKRETIDMLAQNFATSFARIALKHAEEKAMTQLQKDVAIRKADEEKELLRIVEDMMEEKDRSEEL